MLSGLLAGVKVVELPGLAPVPFCGMILADFGADVLVIQKATSASSVVDEQMNRGKQKMVFDFNFQADISRIRKICQDADVLLDPFRPGVLEQIGLDPYELLEENPKLIIAMISSYGQNGPYYNKAGHDINFVGLSGLMPAICDKNLKPPANLLGDFAAGSLGAAFAICAALFRREKTGNRGCIIDCSMTEGVAYLGTFVSLHGDSPLVFTDEFAMFSGRCPIYRTYETKDGKFMAVGALEPKFHLQLFQTLGLDSERAMTDMFADPANFVNRLEEIFRSKTQQEWTDIFWEVDACVTPVLDLHDVGDFPQHKDRNFFEKSKVDHGSVKWIPRVAPKVYNAEQFRRIQTKRKSKI